MKIMTLSQHEKHENSMAGVVNLRLGRVQKSGKIESEKTQQTRICRHPKTITIARSWSFGRSKTGDGSGGNNSLFRYFPDPGGHDGPMTPPKGGPSPPTLDFRSFFIDLGSICHRCLTPRARSGSRTLDPDPAGAVGVKNSRPRPRGRARGRSGSRILDPEPAGATLRAAARCAQARFLRKNSAII